MQSDEKAAVRALIWSIPIGTATTLALNALHHRDWAVCYGIGAALSVFSLCSLTIFVPMLIQPGARPAIKGVLAVTLYMKLPIFCGALYYMTCVAASGAGASVFGIALAPMVITGRAILGMVRRPAWQARASEPVAQQKTQTSGAPLRAPQTAMSTEGG